MSIWFFSQHIYCYRHFVLLTTKIHVSKEWRDMPSQQPSARVSSFPSALVHLGNSFYYINTTLSYCCVVYNFIYILNYNENLYVSFWIVLASSGLGLVDITIYHRYFYGGTPIVSGKVLMSDFLFTSLGIFSALWLVFSSLHFVVLCSCVSNLLYSFPLHSCQKWLTNGVESSNIIMFLCC